MKRLAKKYIKMILNFTIRRSLIWKWTILGKRCLWVDTTRSMICLQMIWFNDRWPMVYWNAARGFVLVLFRPTSRSKMSKICIELAWVISTSINLILTLPTTFCQPMIAPEMLSWNRTSAAAPSCRTLARVKTRPRIWTSVTIHPVLDNATTFRDSANRL